MASVLLNCSTNSAANSVEPRKENKGIVIIHDHTVTSAGEGACLITLALRLRFGGTFSQATKETFQ